MPSSTKRSRLSHALSYALAGALAGGRTTAAALFAAEDLRRRPRASRSRLARAMASDRGVALLRGGAVLETVIDKLPGVGDRTALVGVAARVLSGSTSGAALAADDDHNPLLGAVLGGAAAIASTFALFEARRALHRRTGVPDVVGGVLEDLLLLGVGRLAMRGR
ncbi:MAG: hypothetical protein IPH07_38755 [Deltaproteobacteria bacterium]|nr:hypothetical protein [Deltaproteobacteria bacterium]MBK8236168.1 hypothetical protein [Deltaproteobacteria bacterium]MBK8713774.1 hypothetical protein [Deltaproteobacteria bacterium]MBP7290277.1 hypothetical protein [Nannocystaceae bacterium]